MSERMYKKEMALVQLLSQSGAIPLDHLQAVEKLVPNIHIDKMQGIVLSIKN